jgi:hypothetical protein
METETILWSKHVIILVIHNLKLILAILRHQRPLVCNKLFLFVPAARGTGNSQQSVYVVSIMGLYRGTLKSSPIHELIFAGSVTNLRIMQMQNLVGAVIITDQFTSSQPSGAAIYSSIGCVIKTNIFRKLGCFSQNVVINSCDRWRCSAGQFASNSRVNRPGFESRTWHGRIFFFVFLTRFLNFEFIL